MATSISYRSNLLGTNFAVYDNGDSPKRGGRETMRRELSAVVYVSQLTYVEILQVKHGKYPNGME